MIGIVMVAQAIVNLRKERSRNIAVRVRRMDWKWAEADQGRARSNLMTSTKKEVHRDRWSLCRQLPFSNSLCSHCLAGLRFRSCIIIPRLTWMHRFGSFGVNVLD